jgi:class 3 adenylate cyclase
MVTVMFVDICGFTPMADRMTARQTVALLGEFFDVVVPVVVAHGGYAHQLYGDGVMAVFGAPEPLPDHADRAVSDAVEVAAAVESHFGGRIRIGVGLNSGLVLAGTIGGGGKREFGVVGDPVNVAARIEKATRQLGEPVLVSEATRCLLEDGGSQLASCGSIRAKGKAAPIPVHAPRPGGVPLARNDRETVRG